MSNHLEFRLVCGFLHGSMTGAGLCIGSKAAINLFF